MCQALHIGTVAMLVATLLLPPLPMAMQGPYHPPALGDPPHAEFVMVTMSTIFPHPVGRPLPFENLTTGTEPISYTWDFGDGTGSTEINPTHTYTHTNPDHSHYWTIGLTAQNAYGTSSISHTVEVQYIILLPLWLNGGH